ncbi:hypothetical protein ACFODZ_07665 [Marinicella sediminis]|uniref:Uncharacterized protein n=1 Tax=Marinicella sediminis TaxID=1792834 RepID=A0ABV7JB58_9GAMM|nr:hypothetical protein [Marinicella sediminis]
MNNIRTILQLNALNCLLFGALFVFLPAQVSQFLSSSHPMPELVMAILGVVLNLFGLLLLWLAKKPHINKGWVLMVAVADFSWVLFTVVLLLLQVWVTTVNGMTAAGLIAILVGWFGWLEWQYHQSPSKS